MKTYNSQVTDVINQLKGQGGNCPNTNNSGSDCTTLVSHNAAAISICGGSTDLTCDQVADFADQIQQACLSIDRAGGQYELGGGAVVEVISS